MRKNFFASGGAGGLVLVALLSAACSPTKAGNPLDDPDDLLATLPSPQPETLMQELNSSFIARPPNAPPVSVGSGGSGSSGQWNNFIGNYPTMTVVDVQASGTVHINVDCPGCPQGNLGPAGRLLFPNTCTGYGAMFLNWRDAQGQFAQWNACASGPSGSLIVYGPVTGGRAIDSGPGCPCFTGCRFQGCCCGWSYQGGGDSISLTRVDAKLDVTVDRLFAPQGEEVVISPSPGPGQIRGVSTPFYLQGYRFDPDPPTNPGEQLTDADYEACERQVGNVCHHRMRRPGVLRTGAVVNGKYFEVPKRLETQCNLASCKCMQAGETKYGVGLPVGHVPLKVRCTDKLGGGELGVDFSLTGKAEGTFGTCFNDCESEHEGKLQLSVKTLMCDKGKEVAVDVHASGEWKGCKECSSTCSQICKPEAGCQTLHVGGGAEGSVSQTLNPKWLQALTKKLKIPGLKLQCGVDLGISMGGSATFDQTKDHGACPNRKCEDCLGTTATVKGGALARGACALTVSKPGKSGLRPAGACQACVELKADAEGSLEQTVGACANHECWKMESKYSGRAQIKATVPLHWFEVEADCGFGGEGCTAANSCGGCGSCQDCDHDEWKSSCNVTLKKEGEG